MHFTFLFVRKPKIVHDESFNLKPKLFGLAYDVNKINDTQYFCLMQT